MSPEYGAIMGFFPVDHVTLQYLKLTGRRDENVEMIEGYLRANGMFVDYEKPQQERVYSSLLRLELSDVVPCISGPNCHDCIPLTKVKANWHPCLDSKAGSKGFDLPKESQDEVVNFSPNENSIKLKHGSVIIAAITSCINTSNPSVMLAAGLLAKNAYDSDLKVKSWVKTSFAPGSKVLMQYLLVSGLEKYFNLVGFNIAEYGCTSVEYSEDLNESIASAILDSGMIVASVLSGDQNFESCLQFLSKANYLASPPLVVAYALPGTVDIDFVKEPIGNNRGGAPIYLRNIWPTIEQIAPVFESSVLSCMFTKTYKAIRKGNLDWNKLVDPENTFYSWDPKSTYIHKPPWFKNLTANPPDPQGIKEAYCLLHLGDKIMVDQISPAGSIRNDSPSAKYLFECGVAREDFDSYGSCRGNDEVMARGTFTNAGIFNKLLGRLGPKTIHIPTSDELDVFDAARRYKEAGYETVVLAGTEYGSGSSIYQDWAAKGQKLLGIKAVIAKSFDRVHRSNLVRMGIIPLCFKSGEDTDTLGLTGHERYTVELSSKAGVKSGTYALGIRVLTNTNLTFTCTACFDTEELEYFKNGGILPYVIRNCSSFERRKHLSLEQMIFYLKSFNPQVRDTIQQLADVLPDGHCGYRAVALALAQSSLDGWKEVRKYMLHEIRTKKDVYGPLLGGEFSLQTMDKRLDYLFPSCGVFYYMHLPDMGSIIASCYNRPFIVLSCNQSLTYLPLMTPPPPDHENISPIVIASFDVHFMNVTLKTGAPIPPNYPF